MKMSSNWHCNFTFFFIAVVLLLSTFSVALDSPPVILIPGDGGCQLDATLDRPSTLHPYICSKKKDLFTLWLNLEEFIPYLFDCFIDNMKLIYDQDTRTSRNTDGVDIIVPGFGNTSSVEWLDPSKVSYGAYFTHIVEALVGIGYERGVNLRAAPYDFRKAPNEGGPYFWALQQLIEQTFKANGRTPVVLISHSLGCMYTLYFLNQQPESWKSRYIWAWAPISGPFAGTTKVARMITSGDNLSEYVIPTLTARIAQRSYPSSVFLLPNLDFWKPDEILIQTPKANYTSRDYMQLFTDLKYTIGPYLFNDTHGLVRDIKAPKVPVFPIYGTEVATEDSYHYSTFPNSQPTIKMGLGDGTVNLRSLRAYEKWRKEQYPMVREHEVKGPTGEHLAILGDPTVFKFLINEVLSPFVKSRKVKSRKPTKRPGSL